MYKDYHNFRGMPRNEKAIPFKLTILFLHTQTITRTRVPDNPEARSSPVVKSFHYRRSMTRGMRATM